MPEVITPIISSPTRPTSYDLTSEILIATDTYIVMVIVNNGSGFPMMRFKRTGDNLELDTFYQTGTLKSDGIAEANVYRNVTVAHSIGNYAVSVPNNTGSAFAPTITRVLVYNADTKGEFYITGWEPAYYKTHAFKAGISTALRAVILPDNQMSALRVVSLTGAFSEYKINISGIASDLRIFQVYCIVDKILVVCTKGTGKNVFYSIPVNTLAGGTAAAVEVSAPYDVAINSQDDRLYLHAGNRIAEFNPKTNLFDAFSISPDYGSFMSRSSIFRITDDPTEVGVFSRNDNSSVSFYAIKRVGDTFIPEFITRRLLGSDRSTLLNIWMGSDRNIYNMQSFRQRSAGDKQVVVGGSVYGEMPDWILNPTPMYESPVVLEPAPAEEPLMIIRPLLRAHGYMGG